MAITPATVAGANAEEIYNDNDVLQHARFGGWEEPEEAEAEWTEGAAASHLPDLRHPWQHGRCLLQL